MPERRDSVYILQVAYTDCSTTNGVLSFNPYTLRFDNETEGFIYGNSGRSLGLDRLRLKAAHIEPKERYNYDATQAFNYSTYPVSR